MTDSELNNGFIQLALNRMEDAKKHLQEVSDNLKKKKSKSLSCKECVEKQKVIDTLQDTCASYEARLKRFQTLSRKRKNEARRELGFDEKLVVQYGEQVYRDKKSNGNSLEHNSWSNAEVACACGQVEEVDKEKFRLTILRYARTHKFPKNFF